MPACWFQHPAPLFPPLSMQHRPWQAAAAGGTRAGTPSSCVTGHRGSHSQLPCVQALQLIISSLGPAFAPELDAELRLLILKALLHPNRFVRETAYHCLAEVCALLPREQLLALAPSFCERLCDGLVENWSQVLVLGFGFRVWPKDRMHPNPWSLVWTHHESMQAKIVAAGCSCARLNDCLLRHAFMRQAEQAWVASEGMRGLSRATWNGLPRNMVSMVCSSWCSRNLHPVPEGRYPVLDHVASVDAQPRSRPNPAGEMSCAESACIICR